MREGDGIESLLRSANTISLRRDKFILELSGENSLGSVREGDDRHPLRL